MSVQSSADASTGCASWDRMETPVPQVAQQSSRGQLGNCCRRSTRSWRSTTPTRSSGEPSRSRTNVSGSIARPFPDRSRAQPDARHLGQRPARRHRRRTPHHVRGQPHGSRGVSPQRGRRGALHGVRQLPDRRTPRRQHPCRRPGMGRVHADPLRARGRSGSCSTTAACPASGRRAEAGARGDPVFPAGDDPGPGSRPDRRRRRRNGLPTAGWGRRRFRCCRRIQRWAASKSRRSWTSA